MDNPYQMTLSKIFQFFLAISFLMIGFGVETLAQTKTEKRELANEYLTRENYPKALDLYESISDDEDIFPTIYKNYFQCLKKAKPNSLESAIRKAIKRFPNELPYKTYYFDYLKNTKKDEKELDKYTQDKLIPWLLKSNDRAKAGYTYFVTSQSTNYANLLLDEAVKAYGLETLWKEVYQSQFAQKKYESLCQTLIKLLEQGIVDEIELQTYLQDGITTNEFATQFQIALLKQIQAAPTNPLYPSFLAWIYIQKKDFDGAFIQYKALDMIQNTGGTRCFQLGEFAINNDLNPVAIKCFDFIIKNFPQSQYRFQAQQKLVQLREEVVKTTYPVKQEEVRNLIEEYNNLAQSQYLNLYDLTIKVAELYGKYLNKPDSAILILEGSMTSRRWPFGFQNKAKILLGDMYILKEEPWEASLLYGQVEKDEPESLIGYEAKLKNAKVFYFKGEFELCQEQLDVLKQSTSRDISNDAIELGLLLQDLLAEDTTGFFLSKFADIDLLTFQGNYPKSIDEIEKLMITISNPVVVERLKYRLFKNFEATRQFQKAIEQLEQIHATKTSDLYLDDALFYSGIIYSDELKDKEKAMNQFLTLIKEIPGSVFAVEARKRLRILRGDGVN